MTTILVPPGIGDIYWVLVKLRGFMRAHGITGRPEIWVDSPSDRRRSAAFVERVPFVRFGGYHDSSRIPLQAEMPLAAFHRRRGYADAIKLEAYKLDARHAFQNVYGFDWFVSFNGSINHGRSLDEVEPQWPAEWELGIRTTLGEREYGRKLRARHGPYVVAAFFDHGFYRKWLRQLPPTEVYSMLVMIRRSTGHRIVLTGASWDDSPLNRQLMELDEPNGHLVSLVGRTTLEQYFGAVRGSEGCIGFPAGNTMMAAVFGRPTGIIWNDFFTSAMHRHALAPSLLGRNYLPMNTSSPAVLLAQQFSGLVQTAV